MDTLITFNFSIHESVRIKAIGITGHVDAQMNSINGTEYRVGYWYNGERKSVWMYGREIESLDAKSK